MKKLLAAAIVAVVLAQPAVAKTTASPKAEAQALQLAQQIMAMRSVAGPDNRTGDVASAIKAALVAGGWADGDVVITPHKDTAYLIATWRGSNPALKPLILSGHMDVVEAKREDWQRDPFVPVVENGYLYGRGATDMKLDTAILAASLIELRRQGYRPKRSIVMALSGDEETTMETSQIIANRFADAFMVLNADSDANGVLDEDTGEPRYYRWLGAEKTYSDFQLVLTDPGGHSARPTAENAIARMSAALVKIGNYRFAAELSPLMRESFAASAEVERDPALARAKKAFAANPGDAAAIAVLRTHPVTNGLVSTTCVPTLISGGHALNALPQRVTVNVNCRIYPGHQPAETMAELASVIDDPRITITDVTEGSVPAPSSPPRADVAAAIKRAIGLIHPGIPVFPDMATGASDNMWFRSKGVDSYIVSPIFMKSSDIFSHGLNERTPVAVIGPGITFYLSLLRDFTK